MDIYVYVWIYMDRYGHLWTFMGIYGYIWIFMNIHGYVSGYVWGLWICMHIVDVY